MKPAMEVMLGIIKSQISGTPYDISAFLALSAAEQEELAALAEQHSVGQLLGNTLGNSPEAAGLPASRALVRASMLAFSSTARLEQERRAVCRVLEEAGIPYIQLKGARIRPLYPEPWMRTSCDNDILVHGSDLDRAVDLLTQQLGYRAGPKEFHDVSLYSGSGIHLELHFSIRGRDPQMNRVLDRVWDPENTCPVEGRCEVLQSREFFLFHIIAHAAGHVLGGGCGIRPLVDLYLLRENLPCQTRQVLDLCEEAGIAPFYHNLCDLLRVWFDGAPPTPATEHLEAFILSGGAYGTQKAGIAVAQKTQGKKMGEVSYRLLLPYDKLSCLYPSLKDHPRLAPAYQVLRWSRLITQGRFRKIRSDLRAVHSIDAAYSHEIAELLEENGLLR